MIHSIYHLSVENFMQKYGWRIFRLKGVLYNRDQNRRVHIQAVQQLFDREFGTEWKPDETKASKVVIIGRDLDKVLLEDGLLQCATRNKCESVLA